MDIHTGQILHQRYEITEQLGQGMAKTYAATRLADEAQVVIKELKFSELENWKAYELFEREIKALESLKHHAFPELLDHFEIKEGQDTWMYLVLERLPGKNLQEAMKSGWRPDQNEVKQLAIKALEALIYLHHLSPPLVHRDIKPSNLIWHNQQLYLIDFGAVQDVMRPEGSSTIVGTFGYMAPEQFSGRAVPASDLYALGATLVHLLSGRAPAEIPQRELKLDFEDYVTCSHTFSRWLERMLEPVVERRFNRATEALEALQNPRAVSTPTTTAPVTSGAPRESLSSMSAPSGTRVVMRKQNDRLYIGVPAGGIRMGNAFLLLFNGFWLTFVTVWTALAIQGSLLFALFSIPFWAVGLGMLAFNMNNILANTTLKFTPTSVKITKSYLSAIYRDQQYDLDQLMAVQNHLSYKSNNTPHFAIQMEIGVKKVNFGLHLSRVEKEWIRNEILYYAQQHLPRDKSKKVIQLSESAH